MRIAALNAERIAEHAERIAEQMMGLPTAAALPSQGAAFEPSIPS